MFPRLACEAPDAAIHSGYLGRATRLHVFAPLMCRHKRAGWIRRLAVREQFLRGEHDKLPWSVGTKHNLMQTDHKERRKCRGCLPRGRFVLKTAPAMIR